VEDRKLVRLLRDRILARYLEDEVSARIMQPDGSYTRPKRNPGKRALSSQSWFLKRHEV